VLNRVYTRYPSTPRPTLAPKQAGTASVQRFPAIWQENRRVEFAPFRSLRFAETGSLAARAQCALAPRSLGNSHSLEYCAFDWPTEKCTSLRILDIGRD